MFLKHHVRSVLAIATTSFLVAGCGSLLSKIQPSATQAPSMQVAQTSPSPLENGSASAGNRTPYPTEVAQNFMNACMQSSGGKQEACSCIFSKIQDRYSLQEYIQIEEASKVTGKMPQEVENFIEACRPQ